MKSKMLAYAVALFVQIGGRRIGDEEPSFIFHTVRPGNVQDDIKLNRILMHGCKRCGFGLHKLLHKKETKDKPGEMYYSCDCFEIRELIWRAEREWSEIKDLVIK